jgi:hypothetical protein
MVESDRAAAPAPPPPQELISEDDRPEAGRPDGRRNLVFWRGEGTLIACGEDGAMASREIETEGETGGDVTSIVGEGAASCCGISLGGGCSIGTSVTGAIPGLSTGPSMIGVGDRGSSSGAILSADAVRLNPGSESKF